MGIIEFGIFFVVVPVIVLAMAYWVIRLAVRDGTMDAERRWRIR